jgi:hypothetical protein
LLDVEVPLGEGMPLGGGAIDDDEEDGGKPEIGTPLS